MDQISFLFCLYYCFRMSEKCVSLDLLILVWYFVFDVILKSMSWQSYGTYIVCIVYWRLLFYSNFLDIILELPQNVSVLYIKFMMFMKLLLILVMIRVWWLWISSIISTQPNPPPPKKKKTLNFVTKPQIFK